VTRTIRPARVEECDALTALAMRSKAHWGYDDAFMAACRNELTIRPEHVDRVDVAEDDDGRVVGMVRLEPDTLEDLFVEPDAIGTGVGRALVRHVVRRAATEGMRTLSIDADPNARPFYEAMGAVLVGESPSASIPGRMLPRLELSVAKAIVRHGYDEISLVYRADDEEIPAYLDWLDRLAPAPGDRVLDLGCGCGVPMARLLVERGCEVLGVDISDEQIRRARALVAGATFERADVTAWDRPDGSFDAIVSLYALIHLPREDLEALVPRLARWLRPGGRLLATVGADDWTGVEDFGGAPMFWDHPDPGTTFGWLIAAGFEVEHRDFVPEGSSGHELVIARRR
jgi:SAM-dependent methyltransferase/GNAT superfamily N-acetyltransferase